MDGGYDVIGWHVDDVNGEKDLRPLREEKGWEGG